MAYFSDHLPTVTISTLLILVFWSCFGRVLAGAEAESSSYQLALSFVPEQSRVTGTARILVKPGAELSLLVSGLTITSARLEDRTGTELTLEQDGEFLRVPTTESGSILTLSYNKSVFTDPDNLISPAGISLISNYYPVPDQPVRFQLSATLPEGFTAITESDRFPLQQEGRRVSAGYLRPTTAIHFIAGPYLKKERAVRDGLSVYSMFFQEDEDLADGYLQAAVDYLKRYEEELGPYPFHHYVIVANRNPTGYGMPTFTLLGQMVLRLPFIKETSLGHEIVHSWFGNGVEVDYSKGNWCEGLTAFLADHAYREEKGEGVADRLETITRYHSYVHGESSAPLSSFTSASHNQPMARARRSIGYDRGAMFFHELRERIGQTVFQQGIRDFYEDNNGKLASWDSLQKSFEGASGQDLTSFFRQRLERSETPDLAVEDIRVTYPEESPVLSFSLLQRSKEPFTLNVPISIETVAAPLRTTARITAPKTTITIRLDQRPLEFTIDPTHSFLRRLSDSELPAVWSRLLGSPQLLAILGSEEERAIYQPLLDVFDQEKVTLILARDVTNKQLTESDLLFFGTDQPPARSLFGPPEQPENGFSLDVRQNPLNMDHVAALISSSSEEISRASARRLSHYGKYSTLKFRKGQPVSKHIKPTESGLRFVLEELPEGGAFSATSSFLQLVDQLATNRVIYVGETHTSMADHLLQLRIIEGLHKKNKNLAIGMEMFPTSSQAALDQYTRGAGEMDLRSFLKESDYYNVWRFDFRYFQDIFNFAKENKLPVIGLNIDRKVVAEVFRTGSTDSLDEKQQKLLPRDRDLDMAGYTERLSFMHNIHKEGKHGSGAESGFIQAQGIWDETMARNIAVFLKENPDFKMVVLAGSQHTRKDSGIPPRVARRLPVKQASVINLYNGNSPTTPGLVADYFFLAPEVGLPETPKIGIILDEETVEDVPRQKISQFSPGGKAEAAGLRKGDILEEVNGYPVSTMADLRVAMFNTEPGETIEITVERQDGKKDQRVTVAVELTIPPPSPH